MKQSKTVATIDNAREAGNTWIHNEKEYELFLVNGKGGVGMPILDAETNEPAVIVNAEFAWENSAPFMEHLEYGLHDEIDPHTGAIKSKADNVRRRNAKLFRTLLQSGSIIEIGETGERSEPQPFTRSELLDMLELEHQADLIDAWLESVTIKRFTPKGVSRINSIFRVDKIFFTVSIGDSDNPRHVILLEFDKPSVDARRDYEDKAAVREKDTENGTVKNWLVIDNEYKFRFARKYFVGAKGVSIGDVGVPYDGSDAHREAFRKGFNPHLWVRLADHLANAFNNAGK